MLQNIISEFSPELISGITDKFGLSNQQASQTVEVTKNSLASSFTKEATSGNITGLLQIFNQSGSLSQNSIFQNIAKQLAGSYAEKLGLSPDMASKLSTFVLPLILNKVSGSTSGTFDKSDLSKLITGAAGASLKNKAGGLLKGGLGNIFN